MICACVFFFQMLFLWVYCFAVVVHGMVETTHMIHTGYFHRQVKNPQVFRSFALSTELNATAMWICICWEQNWHILNHLLNFRITSVGKYLNMKYLNVQSHYGTDTVYSLTWAWIDDSHFGNLCKHFICLLSVRQLILAI